MGRFSWSILKRLCSNYYGWPVVDFCWYLVLLLYYGSARFQLNHKWTKYEPYCSFSFAHNQECDPEERVPGPHHQTARRTRHQIVADWTRRRNWPQAQQIIIGQLHRFDRNKTRPKTHICIRMPHDKLSHFQRRLSGGLQEFHGWAKIIFQDPQYRRVRRIYVFSSWMFLGFKRSARAGSKSDCNLHNCGDELEYYMGDRYRHRPNRKQQQKQLYRFSNLHSRTAEYNRRDIFLGWSIFVLPHLLFDYFEWPFRHL